MWIENIYRESDRANRRRLVVGAGAVLLILILLTINIKTVEKHAPPPANLLEPQRLLKAAALCDELPKPEGFARVSTRRPQYASSAARVFHGYRSEREFDEVIPTLLIWFAANGWRRASDDDFEPAVESDHPNRQVIFSKNNTSVNILYYFPDSDGYLPAANYEFSCRYADPAQGLSFTLSH